MNGRIIKLTGGNYTVKTIDDQLVLCKPLGVFRHRNIQPKVGDFVVLDQETIIEVAPRRNNFYRPNIANVDQVLLIQSAKEPDFSYHLLDRFLVLICSEHVDPIIIITKIDLLNSAELTKLQANLSYYQRFFPVYYTSSFQQAGLEQIHSITKGKINVVAGQTGAGKSSLLNALNPVLDLATDEISKALGRGKHTTRTVELIPFGDGWIADTPGFSKLEFAFQDASTLKERYPDFSELAKQCRFLGCNHIHEPSCAVKTAVERGEILLERYQNYVTFYEEIKAIKPKYPR